MKVIQPLPSRQHDCSRPGCKVKATCTPVLVVPASPMAANKIYTGCRSVLWLPLCNQHFSAASVRGFLNDEVIQGMRASIEYDFRTNQSLADWNKAAIQKLSSASDEFKKYEQIALNVAGGVPADIAVKAIETDKAKGN